MVIRRHMKAVRGSLGKFEPKWEGPYITDTVYSNDAYHLTTAKEKWLELPINSKFLKKYLQ